MCDLVHRGRAIEVPLTPRPWGAIPGELREGEAPVAGPVALEGAVVDLQT